MKNSLYIGNDVAVATGYDSLYACRIAAILDVVATQQMGSRHHDSAQLMQSQHAEPPLAAAFEDEHHHIASSDTETLEVGSGTIGVFLQVAEGEQTFLAVFVGP